MKPYSDFAKSIHKEGWSFIFIFLIVTIIIGLISSVLFWICVVLTVWCVYFFRDPQRQTPVLEDAIISPADGIVQKITDASAPGELEFGEGAMKRVSIFLNVFDVHVNRVPADGKILNIHYHPGKFFNASLDKASIHNERQSVSMETKNGTKIAFVQIAGLIARRIVCDLEEKQEVLAGERYGIIRFGSRVDVYLPKEVVINVAEGQRMIGGETIIANLGSLKKNSKSKGEVRQIEFVQR